MTDDRIKEMLGTWKHESAENVDNYLKKIGIGIVLRTVIKSQKPVVKLIAEEDRYHAFIESVFKNHDWTFKLGEKFELVTLDGRHFMATMTIDQDGKLIEMQEAAKGHEKNIPSVIKRYVEKNKLIVVEESGGVSSKRTFTRV